ncbi:MAG: hypothetical protein GY872_00895 [Roseibacillus sp.]|nr:hypothetical protein [Roseibacillus sp.]HJM65870.1 hypothetical protein [Roseibacillus sp.]
MPTFNPVSWQQFPTRPSLTRPLKVSKRTANNPRVSRYLFQFRDMTD